ncbi:MAG: Lrp/AsnC family transcriptional regulator [Pseudomonadota bacterium]
MPAVSLDAIDRKILRALQRDAEAPIAQLADQVGLSQTPCWRRIKRLTEAGVIRARVAVLDPAALGLDLTAFIQVKTNQHNEKWLERFARGVADLPNVLEFHRMSGETDYLLKVVARDMAHFDQIYRELIQIADMFDVSSHFSMEQIKDTTALPLDELTGETKR